MHATPTTSSHLRHRGGDFESFVEGLDYAARGEAGFNYYSARGELLRALPYRELRERARETAQKLIAAGLRPGDRLLLIADTDADFTILFCATQYASLLPVPVALPTSLGGKEAYIATLRRQMETCRARAAVGPTDLLGYLEQAAEGLSLVFVATPETVYGLPSGSDDLRPFGPGDRSYLQFSSGSTRFPKGVDIPQRALMANCRAISTSGLDLRAGDRFTSWLPLYHDMGLVGFLLVPMMNQFSGDYITTRDFARRPLMWPTLVSMNRGTISYSPSFGYDLCARRVGEGRLTLPDIDLGSWRAAGIGGDMVQPTVMQRFAEAFAPVGFRREALVPSYGMAEATLALAFAPLEHGVDIDRIDRAAMEERQEAVPSASPDDSVARSFVLCGRALAGHQMQVRGAGGKALPDRKIGKIFVKGPSLMAGYDNLPEETAQALSTDGWLDTGDLGYLLDGQIVITGRSKDLIIIAGRNIWPQDLEWAVEEELDLRRGAAAAFAVENDQGGDQVVVMIECRSEDPTERDRLRRDAASLLQRTQGVDATIALVPARTIPQTSSGKISRARARTIYLERGPEQPALMPSSGNR